MAVSKQILLIPTDKPSRITAGGNDHERIPMAYAEDEFLIILDDDDEMHNPYTFQYDDVAEALKDYAIKNFGLRVHVITYENE